MTKLLTLVIISFSVVAHANWYIVPCEHDSDEQCKVFAQGFVPKNVIVRVPANLAEEPQEVLETYDYDLNECGEQPGIIDRGIKILSDAVNSITGNKEVETEVKCEPNIVKRVRVNSEKKAAIIEARRQAEALDKSKRDARKSEIDQLKSSCEGKKSEICTLIKLMEEKYGDL